MVDAAELARFVAVPAPTGSEQARIAWLEQRLSDLPGRVARDAVGNLVWRSDEATGSPELLLMAHVDTVFHGLEEIDVSSEGDELIGPGVGDNAAGVMAVVWTLAGLESIPSGLAVAFTVGEEGLGNSHGALHACRELRPAMAVAVEGHGLDKVVTDHVGSIRARLAVDGPGGHSWSERGSPSAIHALLGIGLALAAGGANVGKIAGGEAVNAIAAHAELIVERRSIEQGELDEFQAELGRFEVDLPLRLGCEIVGRRPAGRIDPSHPLVEAVVAVRRLLGVPGGWDSGSTDANAAASLGIPAISIGCTRGSGMHTPGERIELGPLDLGCRQLSALIAALLVTP